MNDWISVIRGAPYNLVTELEECPFDRFWVVQLASPEGGEAAEVYQNAPDLACDPSNPWLRLKRLCADYDGLRIVNMAYVVRKGVGQQVNLTPNAPGYFYAKRIRKMFNAGPYAFQDQGEGVGVLDEGNDLLTIYWTSDDGRQETEYRRLSEQDQKHQVLQGLIRA